MKNFSIILLVILVIIVLYLASGCSGIPVVKRSSAGPDAVCLWKYRNEPYKSDEETEEYEEQLQVKIDEYLRVHPEIDELIFSKLKGLSDTIEGMNKEQVELLYGKPDIITTDPKQLKYNTNEKWVYKMQNIPTYFLYFQGDIIVAMETFHYEPILP